MSKEVEKISRARWKFLKSHDKHVGFIPLVTDPSSRKNNGALKAMHTKNKVKSVIQCVGAEPHFTGYYSMVPFAESHNTVETSVLNALGKCLHIVRYVPLS